MNDRPDLDIKIEPIEVGPDVRKLDPAKWKVEIENGSPLLSVEGEGEHRVVELRAGMEVLAPTMFGYFKGVVHKDDDGWTVRGTEVVALVEWCIKRECFVSSSSYHMAGAEELARALADKTEG